MVFEKIREIIAEQTGKNVEEITLETNVKEDRSHRYSLGCS